VLEVDLKRDIFRFWSEMPEDADVHPADESVLASRKHGFELRGLPGPYAGPLRTASVVLLFLSPGLDDRDVAHAATKAGRRWYVDQRTGKCDLPNEEQHPPAYRWLNRVIRQFGIDYGKARSTVATLNIGAYKSVHFTDWSMLSALPSSKVCLDWAQSVLFPQAKAGKRVVVCLRSANYWGLRVGESVGSLFCPPCTRGAIMHHGEMREDIKSAVQNAILHR
jgi:hypothetical protein